MLSRILSGVLCAICAGLLLWHAFDHPLPQLTRHPHPRRSDRLVLRQRPRQTMPTYTGTDADYPDIPNFVPLQTEPDIRPKTHRHQDHGPFRRAELPDRKLQPLHDRSPGFLRAPIKAQNASAAPVPAEGLINATVVTRGPPRSRALLRRDDWNPWGAAHLKDYIGSGYLMECGFARCRHLPFCSN
jgi:hypothetical protein